MFGTTVVQWSFPFQSSAWRRLGSIIDTRRRRSIIVRKFFRGWQRHGCSKENYNRMMNGTNMLVLLQKTCWQLNMHMDKQQTCFQASMHCMFPHRNFSILQWWYLFLLPKFSSTPFDRIEPGWPMQHWSCNKFATIMEHVFVPNIKTKIMWISLDFKFPSSQPSSEPFSRGQAQPCPCVFMAIKPLWSLVDHQPSHGSMFAFFEVTHDGSKKTCIKAIITNMVIKFPIVQL